MKKVNALALAVSTAILIAPMAASAYEKGDILLKFGSAAVNPKSTSDDIVQIPGQAVTANTNIQLGLSGTYMLSDKLGIELLAVTPFTHDITAKGGTLDGADIGDIKHLPPTLSAQYYFMGSQNKFKPYVGVGLNYTIFFSEDVGADAAGLGAIEIKAMEKAGFSKPFSAAVTASSSIIGPIIPPSVIMVIYAVLSGESIAKLFLAGIVPGLFLGFVLMVLIYVLAVTKRIDAPVTPRASFREVTCSAWRALPGLLAPLLLVVGLLSGVATPTELGAIVTVYAIVLGFLMRELTLSALIEAARSTVYTIGALVFILACAAPISWLISVLNVPETLQVALLTISDNPIILLLMINVMLLIAGLVMETTAIMLIAVPTLWPLIGTLGMDPTQFGVMLIFNLLIGAITPPFGVILFIMMDVAKISYGSLVRAMIPFYIPIVITLLVITFVPAVTLFLPELLTGK